jgi:hypothetical protein
LTARPAFSFPASIEPDQFNYLQTAPSQTSSIISSQPRARLAGSSEASQESDELDYIQPAESQTSWIIYSQLSVRSALSFPVSLV